MMLLLILMLVSVSVFVLVWVSAVQNLQNKTPPAGSRLLASIFHLLTFACWLPAGIHLPPADFRLLASIFHLLTFGVGVACWHPSSTC